MSTRKYIDKLKAKKPSIDIPKVEPNLRGKRMPFKAKDHKSAGKGHRSKFDI